MTHPNRLLTIIAALLVAACTKYDPAAAPSSPNANRFEGAEIEIYGEGGLGAFATRSRAQRQAPAFLFTRHRICSVSQCQAAIDSASGVLRASAADSLFGEVERNDPFALRDDYGITQGGADMVTYTMRVTMGGRTKTVRADDGTMPEAMRRIDSALRATIDAARK